VIQPVLAQEDFAFTEKVRDVETARGKLRIGGLDRLPKLPVRFQLLFLRNADNRIHILRACSFRRRCIKSKPEGGAAINHQPHVMVQMPVQRLENLRGIIHEPRPDLNEDESTRSLDLDRSV
jgi:hypothetical protein